MNIIWIYIAVHKLGLYFSVVAGVCNYFWILKIAGRNSSKFEKSVLSAVRTLDLPVLRKDIDRALSIQTAVTNIWDSHFHNIVIIDSQCLQMHRPLRTEGKHVEEMQNKGNWRKVEARGGRVEATEGIVCILSLCWQPASIYSHRPACLG